MVSLYLYVIFLFEAGYKFCHDRKYGWEDVDL